MKALRFSRFYLLVTFLILCSWEAVQAAPAITISPASGPPPHHHHQGLGLWRL